MSKKFLSILVAIAFLCAVMFSAIYISDNMHHHCTGQEDCPICMEIRIAEAFLATIKYAPVIIAVLFCIRLVAETFTGATHQADIQETLVTLKVLLLD